MRKIIELKDLSHSLQFIIKQSSMQQHELKKYVEFTVHKKPDKMKKLRNLQSNRPFFFALSSI